MRMASVGPPTATVAASPGRRWIHNLIAKAHTGSMSHEATAPLTETDVARYREDGAICIRRAFALDWIERLRAAIDADMRTPGPMVRINTPEGKPGLFFVDFQL